MNDWKESPTWWPTRVKLMEQSRAETRQERKEMNAIKHEILRLQAEIERLKIEYDIKVHSDNQILVTRQAELRERDKRIAALEAENKRLQETLDALL